MKDHLIHISNPHAQAVVSIYGGQVLSYIPSGADDVLWLSPIAVNEPDKAIRGGIPICWPWFGPKADHSSHGFARTREWSVVSQTEMPDQSTELLLSLSSDPSTQAIWPFDFTLLIKISIGKTLQVVLVTENQSLKAFTFSEALHSYFHVGEISQIQIEGLPNCDYYDKVLDRSSPATQQPILIDREVDRIYHHRQGSTITDPVLRRTIHIEKEASANTIVWNPWAEKSKTMKDLESQSFRKFVCVESGNVNPSITLAAGKKHFIKATIWLADQT